VPKEVSILSVALFSEAEQRCLALRDAGNQSIKVLMEQPARIHNAVLIVHVVLI
jgi:hypothetical protein